MRKRHCCQRTLPDVFMSGAECTAREADKGVKMRTSHLWLDNKKNRNQRQMQKN